VSTAALVALDDLGRLSRTVRHLRPGQVGQRIRLRAQRMALDHSVPLARRWLLDSPCQPGRRAAEPAAVPGWPAGFSPLDAGLWRDGRTRAALRAGTLPLIGACHLSVPRDDAGTPSWAAANWQAPGAPLLWRFHLYYWDWAWALAGDHAEPDTRPLFRDIWTSWRSAVAPGRGPAWHPYPAALRAWSLCGLYQPLVAGSPLAGPFLAELATHAGFLRRNLETDVGGNHLIKDLKALAGLGVFFADDGLLRWALTRLDRQVRVQVLPDGGHYERAPAYHCQVLADLIDVAGLLRAAGLAEPTALAEAIEAMRGWLGSVLTPAGDVPVLNDGFPVSRRLLAAIAPGAPPAGRLTVLPDTGLARISAGGWQVLADIGPPCPAELPAHAHADTLGCVAYLDGAPLLIDTGSSTYAPGEARDRERSTAAHNTAEVDGRDSTEVWGAFRAGRRARVSAVLAGEDGGAVTVEAAHDGYRFLPGKPVHHRRWSVAPEELRVDDTVTGQGRHRVTLRWHLPPGTGLRLASGGAVATTAAGEIAVAMTAPGELAVTASTAPVGTGLGATAAAPVLTCTLHQELPVRISTIWRRAEPRQELT
jgi:uncharacterized heparinase superfamily protein